MADTIYTTEELKIENLFVDGDTRTFTLKNPRTDISKSDIEELNTFMQTNNVIIGDKYGATFGRIAHATRTRKIRRVLDF